MQRSFFTAHAFDKADSGSSSLSSTPWSALHAPHHPISPQRVFLRGPIYENPPAAPHRVRPLPPRRVLHIPVRFHACNREICISLRVLRFRRTPARFLPPHPTIAVRAFPAYRSVLRRPEPQSAVASSWYAFLYHRLRAPRRCPIARCQEPH